MSKKKSKSQKQRKNIKRKIKQTEKNKQLVDKDKVKYNVPLNSTKTITKEDLPKLKKKNKDDHKLVSQDKVIYNLPLTKKLSNASSTPKNTAPTKKKNTQEKINKIQSRPDLKEIFNPPSSFNVKSKSVAKKNKLNIPKLKFSKKITKAKNTPLSKKSSKKKEKKPENEITFNEKRIPVIKKENKFLNVIKKIYHGTYILFNVTIILFFILFFLGIISIPELEKSTICYVSGLILFLIIIAISYNKSIEGKIFTIILCIVMGFGIYKMQYTYDYIRALNTHSYEHKTYYVVTYDSIKNSNIYNLNDKSIGLLNENKTNIERLIDTKINAKYIEYNDETTLFNDFINQNYRAIIVTENQYKYLENEITEKDIKIIYEISVTAKKE